MTESSSAPTPSNGDVDVEVHPDELDQPVVDTPATSDPEQMTDDGTGDLGGTGGANAGGAG